MNYKCRTTKLQLKLLLSAPTMNDFLRNISPLWLRKIYAVGSSYHEHLQHQFSAKIAP